MFGQRGLPIAGATLLLVTALVPSFCSAQSDSEPDQQLFTVQNVGSTDSGTVRTLFGCSDNGASLSSITLWANTQFIRGLSASLTDGRQNLFGCVNVTATQTGGCNDTNIRSASFTFQPGELVTNLTLWPGYNLQGEPNQRAGALTLVTSLGRSFDFGMTDPRTNPVNVGLGSGIPCGVAPRAGADIDALGFVFLLPVTSSTLQDMYYSGVSDSQGGSASLDVAPLDSNITELVLASQTYNNSGKDSALQASFSSDKEVDMPLSWSTVPGLDSYLKSSVRAAVPQVQTNSSSNASAAEWVLGQSGAHNRTEEGTSTLNWNYTMTVGPGGISTATANAVQGLLTTSYTANLTVLLSSGRNFSIPIVGTFEGMSTSSADVSVAEILAPTTQSNSSKSGGSSNTLAWVLGVIFGILGGLIFAALIAWAVVLIVRRRNKKDDENDQKTSPDGYFVAGKANGAKPHDENNNSSRKGAKDVEMGSLNNTGVDKQKVGSFSFWGRRGKKGAGESNKAWKGGPDPKLDTVVGVPANGIDGRAENGASSSSDRFIVPYVMFRRLRMDAIRNALGLENQGEEENKEPTAQNMGNSKETSGDAEGLSNPPSGASSPRILPTATTMHSEPTDSNDTQKTAEGKPAPQQPPPSPKAQASTQANTHSSDEKVLTGDPTVPTGELPRTSRASERPEESRAERYERNWRLKDRVAAVMALRKAQAKEPANSAASAQEKELTRSQSAGRSSESRESSTLARVAKSIASLPGRRNASKIQHEDQVINLSGRKSPRAASASKQEVEGSDSRPSSKPSTPKRPKWVAHDDAELRLGAGYEAPPDARSTQRNTIDMDNKRIRLGHKYQTEGRNE